MKRNNTYWNAAVRVSEEGGEISVFEALGKDVKALTEYAKILSSDDIMAELHEMKYTTPEAFAMKNFMKLLLMDQITNNP